MSTPPASDHASAGAHAALLAELASALAGAASLDELCDRAVDAVRVSLGTDRASVLLFDQDGVMRFRAWNGLSDEYRAATDGHSPWAPETRDAEPIVVTSVADDPGLAALRDVILREHIQALAFVPITYAGRLLGKYMLYFDQPRGLTDDELQLAGAVADQIAVAVEQHRVAHELQASHEQLEVIFRGVGEGVTVQRPDGTLVYANDAAARGLGFSSPEDLLAAPVAEILAPFEVLTEAGEPFPMEELPGRRVLQGEEDQAEAVLRYRRRDTGEESYAHVRATSVRDTEGNVLYAVNLFRDVTKSRRREEWQRFLADSGEILNTSLDYETTARQLARLVVPRLADWCVVHVAGESGLSQLAIEHVDPARVEWAREAQERYPPDADAETGVPNVVRTGRAELYGEITDEMLQQAARDEMHLELLRRLGLTSAMIVPLAARDRVFGALTFVSESGRRYGEDDLVQAEDLARHAALALDNARLHHDAQQARRDAELAASVSARLHSVTASLARAATADDVARVAVDEGAAALEADAAAVFVHDQHRSAFVTLAHTGYPRDLEVEHASFSTSEDNPVTEALRTRASVVVTSGEELVARWPGLTRAQGATGDEATVAQPIFSGETVTGVLHVAFRSPRTFRAWELAFIETLASQTGQALARARAYDRDHEAAVALQQTLLPSALPSADGIALGAHYVPARYEANVGGDWYDALLLSDGTLAVCVGDVVGHGLAAATAMGQLRNAIRAYLLEDISPGQVLSRLNRFARSIGDGAFSTTVVATVDPARETWRFAGAGHPPPLVLTEGNLRLLELAGPPVGSLDDFDYEQVEAVVERPSFVILYTDGLVERRGARLEDGLARLLEVATESIASGFANAPALVERMLGGEGPADDVAVLVVELLGTRPLALELAAEPSQLVVLREELRPWLRSYGLDEATCHEIIVATGEAAANAIEHPHDPQSTVFRVEGHVDGDELVIRIFDTGRWREQSLPTDRGRGLFFMRELMSDVEIRERDEGTEVVLRRGLGGPP